MRKKALIEWTASDWERFGEMTMLSIIDIEQATEICGLHLHALWEELQPEINRVKSEIDKVNAQIAALSHYLYNRPEPVDDAEMLRHSHSVIITLAVGGLAFAGALASNFSIFWLIGWGLLASSAAAAAITSIPLALGHLAYENIFVGRKSVQQAAVVGITLLGIVSICEFGQARRSVVDQATAVSAPKSYVDDVGADDSLQISSSQNIEIQTRKSLGNATFLMALACELALGFLLGRYIELRTYRDYVAWRELGAKKSLTQALEYQHAAALSQFEVSQKCCMAGIRRAQTKKDRRRPPYHKLVALFALALALLSAPIVHAQVVDGDQGILIDSSLSIARDGTSHELFRQYLHAAKMLLASEPPRTRVWVTSIATDSFGGVREIVTGRTPEARGIFTADLTRARAQLTERFESKSSALTPNAVGTDIFGGLWHLRTLFDSDSKLAGSDERSKSIWIFSDMVNETAEFPMPQLLSIGAERMLERAKASGLIVPLQNYEIHVYGASTDGMNPRAWTTIKAFWQMYFASAGAKLVTYSAECNVER